MQPDSPGQLLLGTPGGPAALSHRLPETLDVSHWPPC
jgi:hypothetical protein